MHFIKKPFASRDMYCHCLCRHLCHVNRMCRCDKTLNFSIYLMSIQRKCSAAEQVEMPKYENLLKMQIKFSKLKYNFTASHSRFPLPYEVYTFVFTSITSECKHLISWRQHPLLVRKSSTSQKPHGFNSKSLKLH